jgi:hypothetical protein
MTRCTSIYLTSSLVDYTRKEGATLALVLNTTELPYYFKYGYECMQKRNYAGPSGLASFPAIMTLPAASDLSQHWPNIVSLIDSVDKNHHAKDGLDSKHGIKFYDAKVGTWYGIHSVSSRLFLVCIITKPGCAGVKQVDAAPGFDGVVRHFARVFGLAAVSECFK